MVAFQLCWSPQRGQLGMSTCLPCCIPAAGWRERKRWRWAGRPAAAVAPGPWGCPPPAGYYGALDAHRGHEAGLCRPAMEGSSQLLNTPAGRGRLACSAAACQRHWSMRASAGRIRAPREGPARLRALRIPAAPGDSALRRAGTAWSAGCGQEGRGANACWAWPAGTARIT